MSVQVTEVVKDVPLAVHLTAREMEILLFMSKGMMRKEIAGLLRINLRTVALHKEHLRAKLASSNDCETVANAFRMGILE
jgi:DNA-binding NarL/FixJ family response regulator